MKQNIHTNTDVVAADSLNGNNASAGGSSEDQLTGMGFHLAQRWPRNRHGQENNLSAFRHPEPLEVLRRQEDGATGM